MTDRRERYGRVGGRALQRRNARLLWLNPRCACGCGRPSDVVDHVVPLHLGGTEDESNLQCLAQVPCHETKTRREMAALRPSKIPPECQADVDALAAKIRRNRSNPKRSTERIDT